MQSPNRSFESGYANFYDKFYENKNYKRELDFIKDLLRTRNFYLSNKRILEIGCGTGNFSVNIQSSNSLTAIDPSSEMITIAKQKFKHMNSSFHQFSISEFNQLSNSQKKFDLIVLLFHVFSYLSKNDIEELKILLEKYLDNEGILIFDYWDRSATYKSPPIATTKMLVQKDSTLIRTVTPLSSKEFNDFTEYYIEIVIKESKLGQTTRICSTEVHILRAYDSRYLDGILHNFNCFGNMDLITGRNYEGENYGNCKFYIK